VFQPYHVRLERLERRTGSIGSYCLSRNANDGFASLSNMTAVELPRHPPANPDTAATWTVPASRGTLPSLPTV